jgi:hypothetical protein
MLHNYQLWNNNPGIALCTALDNTRILERLISNDGTSNCSFGKFCSPHQMRDVKNKGDTAIT